MKIASPRQSLTLLTLVSLLTQTVGAVSVYEMPVSQIPFPHLVPASSYGMVLDARREDSSGQPRVILIEDLHGHMDVQKNIAQLLYELSPRLTRESGAAVPVYVEGIWTPLDPVAINAIPDPAIRETTANYLLSKS